MCDSMDENEHVPSEDVEGESSSPQAPILTADTQTPKRSTSKARLSKVESAQKKAEREAKKAEEDALRAEKKRLKDELKAKKAEELELEKVRKAEELQREKDRKAEEKARKLEEIQQEKARKLEEIQQEKARKAEELEKEKARKAEERARREAENASKKAEQMQKREQKQAAVQKQELVHKQMANIMDKYVKRIDKPSQKETQTSTSNSCQISQRCTDAFDQQVSKQDVNFVSDIIENIESMKKIEIQNNSHSRLNSDSNSCQFTTTTMNNPYELKTRYIHFPEKYFNRPPYYGTLKKALSLQIDPLQPTGSIENIDYTVDSEGEWEEPCRDGEELRSDADDLSDPENMDSDSDADSFIVPHGHLSDDELNEDEQQQSTSTKQAREAAKSHLWDKKVARLNQQRELKPQFGCIYDSNLDEKEKFELTNYFHQFQRILVPKEILQKEDKEQEVTTDETATNKDEKPKKVTKRKSLVSKKGLTNDQQLTAKRTSSVSITADSASPSKRRKMNSNENCSMTEDTDVIMTDVESINPNKINVLEDASNVSDIKSIPLTIISNEEMKSDTPPTCTLLIPKRKQPPA